jgi:hypothetical protein
MTCQDALRRLFDDPKTFLTREGVYRALDKAYPNRPWKQSTIYLHLNFFSVNNPRRKYHPSTEGKCFLFWDGKDGFRKWIPEQDGAWELRDGQLVRIGVDGQEVPAEERLKADATSEDQAVNELASLSIERDLEDWLVHNLELLEAGLTLYRDGDIDGRQLDAGEVGIIDLLALDKRGDFVVLELKAGKASDSVCGQILGYNDVGTEGNSRR